MDAAAVFGHELAHEMDGPDAHFASLALSLSQALHPSSLGRKLRIRLCRS
jgi:hypothetical protein